MHIINLKIESVISFELSLNIRTPGTKKEMNLSINYAVAQLEQTLSAMRHVCRSRRLLSSIYRIDTSISVLSRALPFPLDRTLFVSPTSLLYRIVFYPNPYMFFRVLLRKSGFVTDLRSDVVNKNRENVRVSE